MKYYDIVNSVSLQTGISEEVLMLIYKKYFLFMKSKISDFPFDDIKSHDDFKKRKTSFKLPEIGTIYINYNIIEHIRKNKENESIGSTTDV